MKAIMYHYVREEDNALPQFVYLHVKNFEKQIDYFTKNYNVLSKEDMDYCLKENKIIKDGIILTFDDGLMDHYKYVLPVLKKRNLWGIFYVSTQPYEKKKLLDVHRIHYLLGKFGGLKLFDKINQFIKNSDLIEGNKQLFERNTYSKQNNDEYTTKVKQIINYYIKPEKRTKLLECIISEFNINEEQLFENYYIQQNHILEMIEAGMTVASHGHSHTLFSNLEKEIQCEEIEKSIEILVKLTNNQKTIDTFCYPYGGKQSYNNYTFKCLKNSHIKYAFSVESRDISNFDLKNKFELPRYDCNEFKYGKATKGKQ